MAYNLKDLHFRFTEISKSFIAGTMTLAEYMQKTKDLQEFLTKNKIPFEAFTLLG